MDEQAVAAERLDRVRSAVLGVTVDGIAAQRMQEILGGGRLPTSLEYALIAEATGRTVDWLLQGEERAADLVACRASDYVSPDAKFCVLCLSGEHEHEHVDEDAVCLATFREEPMRDTVYCGERGYHRRHTAWQGSNYYAWLDGDEGAGWDQMR